MCKKSDQNFCIKIYKEFYTKGESLILLKSSVPRTYIGTCFIYDVQFTPFPKVLLPTSYLHNSLRLSSSSHSDLFTSPHRCMPAITISVLVKDGYYRLLRTNLNQVHSYFLKPHPSHLLRRDFSIFLYLPSTFTLPQSSQKVKKLLSSL